MYTIEVNYGTGNSFGSEDVTENVNLVWASKDLARKALKCLSEHYKVYSSSGYSRLSREQQQKQLSQYSWYKPDLLSYQSVWEFSCFVELDDGSFRTLNVSSWCGYFETLYSAKVVLYSGEDEDEDKVIF